MTTAKAWKNLRRELTDRVGIRESAASIICVATPLIPSPGGKGVLEAFSRGSRTRGTT